jgi:hypothetical protein
MESRISKFAATALLLLFVSIGPAVFAAPKQQGTEDRFTRIIRRIRHFFTPTVLEDDWPTNPLPKPLP